MALFESLLEAQQRYFSYRAILVAIASPNYFVLVLVGYRTIIARYIAKWGGIAQMCLCETKCQAGGYRTIFGGLLTSSLKKNRAIWGIAAMVLQYRAIMGATKESLLTFESVWVT